MIHVLVPLAGLAVIGLIFGLICRSWFRRPAGSAKERAALAAELGLSLLPNGSLDVHACFGRFVAIFTRYPPRVEDAGTASRYFKAANIMQGRIGDRYVVAFDCLSGEVGELPDISVLAIHDKHVPEKLLIRPEGAADKAVAATSPFGTADINFESHEFSSVFHVESSSRKFAYDVITPRIMEYLLANPGWSIELAGADAMIYDNQLWKPERIREALNILSDFLNRIPDHVWKELGAERAAEPAGR